MWEISLSDFEVCLLTSLGLGGSGGGGEEGVIREGGLDELCIVADGVLAMDGGRDDGSTGGWLEDVVVLEEDDVVGLQWTPGNWFKGVVASEISMDSSTGSCRDKVDDTPLLEAGIERIDSADIASFVFKLLLEVTGPMFNECRLWMDGSPLSFVKSYCSVDIFIYLYYYIIIIPYIQ